ncbi:hypothetical protein B1987_12420 [Mycobacterium kansasii]|uniref:HTH-type transcriptional regulator n=1 Tax=Mycobacterium attenuatum TaxID=2341086 RepID=A0A498QF86_9MYCO|nr:helix-turn-helix transcriptional regulator [Mycobacterium attenuatum]ORB84466.1 hypothetical protein B1987_12420 [Mycobacterium kansasii]VBA43483.1 Putative HTH-type transcriptional regulator [Mycobacterium attenuatum]VBA59576.1 Putative HTH-type transcriptional regulator [Mycobacterium attenuatum]VBA61868.1 Putative HTH-type transcriptional regulator [Mycobacterium attenuatum]
MTGGLCFTDYAAATGLFPYCRSIAAVSPYTRTRTDLPSRMELLAAGARPRRSALTCPAALTVSELRVARLAASDETNREIARRLFLSLRTVEVHLTSTYRKLGGQSRRQLAAALSSAEMVAAGSR